MKTEDINLNQIQATDETRSRPLNPEVVAEYGESLKAGTNFPPVEVFDDGQGHLRLADGFHRFAAALEVGESTILANVHQGGLAEALKHALGANGEHGYRRTAEDKRYAVRKALQEFAKDSDRKIAELCKVSPTFVGNVRKELRTETVHMDTHAPEAEEKRIGKDGVLRRVPPSEVKETNVVQMDTGEAEPPPSEAQPNGANVEQKPHEAPIQDLKDQIKGLQRSCERVVNTASEILKSFPRQGSRVRTVLNIHRDAIASLHKNSLPKKRQEELKHAA